MTHRWSLRTRFVLFATACLLPLVLVAWYFVDLSNDRNTEQLINNEQTIVDIVNRSLTAYLTDTTSALITLGQQQPVTDAITRFDTTASQDLLGQARIVRRDLNGLFIVNEQSILVAKSGIEAQPLLGSLDVELSQTIENGQTTISDRLTLDDGSTVIVLLVPLTAEVGTTSDSDVSGDAAVSQQTSSAALSQVDLEQQPGAQTDNSKPPGETIGAIGAIIPTTSLDSRVIPFASGRTEIGITNGEDVLVGTSGISQQPGDFLSGQADVISLALAGNTDDFMLTDASGTQRLAVYGPVQFEGTEWAIFVSSPTPRTYASSLYMQGAIVLALAALIILALAVVLGESTARPLRTLARKADAIQRGDFTTDLQPIGSGEIRMLSQAFADMSRQLLAQLNGLEESRLERERQAVQMRDLLRRTLRLQEDERRRIAGEIHDAVSPLITGALYQARAQLMTNGQTPEAEREQALTNVNNLLERASDELHGVIFDLRPPDLDDLGVVAAIEAYVRPSSRPDWPADLRSKTSRPISLPMCAWESIVSYKKRCIT